MKKLKVVVCTFFIVAGIFVAGYKASQVAGQGGQIAAPTRVNATDNLYNSKVGVYWDTMRGATLYRVFRNTTNNSATATAVGTTTANFFFDTTVPANQTAFYWVRAENGAVLSQMSEPDTGTRTGTLQQGGTAPLGPPNAPPGNPLTATKISLGKALFWDEQMSSTKTVSCGTCHHASSGGADPRITGINPGPDGLFNTGDDIRGSAGVPMNEPDGRYRFSAIYGFGDQVTGRASMSYVNAAYAPILFWDGRATGQFNDPITNLPLFLNGASLESQSVGPPVSSVEMGHEGINWTQVASRIAESKPLALSPSVPQSLQTWIDGRTYPELFLEAFGTAEVSPARIAMAIASFERSTFSDQTPWDLDVQGITPLTPQESMGRNLFNSGTIACGVCHGGNRFTDGAFHYIGVRPDTEDIGREAVTGMPNDRGAFRSPGLRNVGLRKSFFHNGKFTTLEEVIDFYDRAGDFDANNKPNLIHVLNLAPGQRAAILAFMRRPMTDPRVANETGPFERPALYIGSNRVPQITGTGRAGSGGQTPLIKAISPPIVGNDKFTLSVSAALGNSSAVLVVDENDPGTPATIPAAGSLARVAATTQNTGAGNGWASVVLQIPDNASMVGRTFFARWYVTDASAANGFSVTQAARFTVFGEASAPTRPAMFDFDGDGRTDIAVYRPENGNWYVLRSSDNTFVGQSFGLANDVLVPADYDGDGKTDAAVFRDGNWFMNRSRDGVQVVSWGVSGDIPQPGDYDGDGTVDVAVYRPSDGRWYIVKSSGGVTVTPFGIAGDKPVAADFDGDGKTDIAVYRGGVWWILGSTSGVTVANFGLADDRPVVGDYDGDGKADVAVYRPSSGTWFYIRSSDRAVTVASYGLAADVPVPGDYDGDGRNDLAVYRPTGGVWFALNSGGTQKIQSWGLATDKPVPSSYVP